MLRSNAKQRTISVVAAVDDLDPTLPQRLLSPLVEVYLFDVVVCLWNIFMILVAGAAKSITSIH